MQAIDEALLLLLRQGIESLLAAQRVFLTGKGLSLMALQPGSKVRSTQVSRRYGVGTPWRSSIGDAGTVHGAGHGRAIRREAGIGRGSRSIAWGNSAIRRSGSGRRGSIGGCAICRPTVRGMRRRNMRGGRARRGGLRPAVSGMLCAGREETGGGNRKNGKKEGGPAREDTSPRDSATFRRGASVCRASSCCAPRHGSPSFSIGRRDAPPHTLRATRLRQRSSA